MNRKPKQFSQNAIVIYNGSTPPKEFMREFAIRCLMNEWDTDAKQLAALKLFVSGKAKAAYDKAVADGKTTFKDIETAVCTACEPTGEQKFNRFYSRKMYTDETIQEYAQALKELLNDAAPKMDVTEKGNLLRAQLSANVPVQYKQMIKLTATLGDDVFNKYVSQVGDEMMEEMEIKQEAADVNAAASGFSNNYRSGDYSSSYQNNFNNQNYGTNQRNNVDQRREFDGYCDWPQCGAYGHKMSFCPVRLEHRQKTASVRSHTEPVRTNNYNNSRNSSNSGNNYHNKNGPPGRPSSSNSQPRNNSNFQNRRSANAVETSDDWFMGANSDECYQADTAVCETNWINDGATESSVNITQVDTKKVRLLKTLVDITVFGSTKTIKALLDPGSDTSFLSPNVIDYENLANHKDEIKWTEYVINGVVANSKSKCMEINTKMKMGEWLGSWKFVVSEHVHRYDAIIGLDFFKRYNTKIRMNQESDIVTIENKPIDILTNVVELNKQEQAIECQLCEIRKERAVLAMKQFRTGFQPSSNIN